MARHLLLADDSVTIQRMVASIFAEEDVRVSSVGDGRKAIELVALDPPDIVLADVGMPGGDGYEVLEHIRGTPALAHIPVLLLTSAFEPVDEARARAAGCTGTLTKPFESQRLISHVRDLLDAVVVPERSVEPLALAPTGVPSDTPAAPSITDDVPRVAVAIRRGPPAPLVARTELQSPLQEAARSEPRSPVSSEVPTPQAIPAPVTEPDLAPLAAAGRETTPAPRPEPATEQRSVDATSVPTWPAAPAAITEQETPDASPVPLEARHDGDDLQLNPEPPPPGFGYEPPRESRPIWQWVVGALIVVALVVFAIDRWRRGNGPSASPPTGSSASDAAEGRRPLGPMVAPLDLPPLDLTDPIVRELLGQLSSRPELVRWLTTTGLIRNAVVVIDNVAEGRSPVQHLQVLSPKTPFTVISDGEMFRADPQSFQRYDSLADTVASMDADGLARIYAALKPRLVEAYRDLGHPDGDIDAAVERALVHVLNTPVVPADAELSEAILSYEYVETRFETLSGAQKLLARTGPRNQLLIQAKLRALGLALGLSDARLPALPQARR